MEAKMYNMGNEKNDQHLQREEEKETQESKKRQGTITG